MCRTDLSLNDFPLPNVTEFISVAGGPKSPRAPVQPAAPPGELPRNHWYYQYDTRSSNTHHRPAIDRHALKLAPGTDVTVTWVSFLAVLVAIDVVWFVHRMARTYSTAKMVLYGCAAPDSEGVDRPLNILFLPARRYPIPLSLCHEPVLCLDKLTDRAWFWHEGFLRPVLHCFKDWYLQR